MPKFLDMDGLSHLWGTIRGSIAEDSGFYDELAVETGRTDGTDYYIATVPVNDGDSETIGLRVAFDANRNPLEQADANHSTLTINGNATIKVDDVYKVGITIGGGVVLSDQSLAEDLGDNDYPLYIGMRADRSIVEYRMNDESVTAEGMLQDGCVDVFNCYFKLVEGSEVTDISQIVINGTQLTEDTRNPQMAMGVKSDGELVFLACDGRTDINQGLTYREVGEMLIAEGCPTVYSLDGGGSTAMVVRGAKINRNIDGDGTVVRGIHYTLNVIKPSKNVAVQEAFANMGLEKQRIIEQIVPQINDLSGKSVAEVGSAIDENGDLNDYTAGGKYYCTSSAVAATISNSPITTRGYSLYVLPQGYSGRAFTQVIITNPATNSDGLVQWFYRYILRNVDGTVSAPYPWVEMPHRNEMDSMLNNIRKFSVAAGGTTSLDLPNGRTCVCIWSYNNVLAGVDFLYTVNNQLGSIAIVRSKTSTADIEYLYSSGTLTVASQSTNQTLRALLFMR